jgi:hypothetical protein
MFRNTYQSGFLSILYSIGSKPLLIWVNTIRRWALNFQLGWRNASPESTQF